jgi:hypothetical protein
MAAAAMVGWFTYMVCVLMGGVESHLLLRLLLLLQRHADMLLLLHHIPAVHLGVGVKAAERCC